MSLFQWSLHYPVMCYNQAVVRSYLNYGELKFINTKWISSTIEKRILTQSLACWPSRNAYLFSFLFYFGVFQTNQVEHLLDDWVIYPLNQSICLPVMYYIFIFVRNAIRESNGCKLWRKKQLIKKFKFCFCVLTVLSLICTYYGFKHLCSSLAFLDIEYAYVFIYSFDINYILSIRRSLVTRSN